MGNVLTEAFVVFLALKALEAQLLELRAAKNATEGDDDPSDDELQIIFVSQAHLSDLQL